MNRCGKFVAGRERRLGVHQSILNRDREFFVQRLLAMALRIRSRTCAQTAALSGKTRGD
jgi:hypothetical protein